MKASLRVTEFSNPTRIRHSHSFRPSGQSETRPRSKGHPLGSYTAGTFSAV
jgi:hypothetical protein